jgi:hypothetical protein
VPATVVAGVLALCTVTQLASLPAGAFAGRPLLLTAYPGRVQAYGALGRQQSLHPLRGLGGKVAETVAGQRVLLARDDALLNGNSLVAESAAHDRHVDVLVPSYAADSLTDRDLAGVTAVIGGTSAEPYHHVVLLASLPGRLSALGFAVTQEITLSPRNTVVVWTR